MGADEKTSAQLLAEIQRLREQLAEYRHLEEQHQRAQEALRHSGELFRALIENAHDIIMVFDAQVVIRYTSPAVKPVLGYEPDELLGTPAYQFVHPDDVAKALDTFAIGVERPGIVLKSELRGRHKNGSWRLLEVTGHNLLNHPSVRGIVINFRDITERKQAEEALRHSEEKYRLIFENAFDVICSFDMQLRVLSVSPSIEIALGYKPEEILGKTLPELNEQIKAMPSESLDLAIARAARVFSGERIDAAQYELTAKDGAKKYAEMSAAPIIQDGRVAAVIIIGRDITERIHHEQQTKQISHKVLLAQEEERERLARDLHDDLGQLLTAVQLDVSRMKKYADANPEIAAQAERIVGKIEEAAKSLRRIYAGLRPPLLDDLGLCSALEAYARDFAARSDYKVNFVSTLDDARMAPLTALTIFRIVQEALTNILRHAGPAEVDIRLEQQDQTITLRIADTGKGFDQDRPAHQVTSGLHGMRERAELCRGDFRIDSAPGKGTRITVTLPTDEHSGKEDT